MSSDGLRNRKSGMLAMGGEAEQDVAPPPSGDPGSVGDNKKLPDLIEKLQVDVDDVILSEAAVAEMEMKMATCGESGPPVEEQGATTTFPPRHQCFYARGSGRERDEYTLTQFQAHHDDEIPWKGGLLAIFLFLVGVGLFIVSGVRLVYKEPFLDRIAPLWFLGLIGFIPGAYHTFYFTGGLLRYYSFTDMPQFNFN